MVLVFSIKTPQIIQVKSCDHLTIARLLVASNYSLRSMTVSSVRCTSSGANFLYMLDWSFHNVILVCQMLLVISY